MAGSSSKRRAASDSPSDSSSSDDHHDRKRSRAEPDDHDAKHSKKEKKKSKKSKKEKEKEPAANRNPSLPVITADDYYNKSTEFQTWLRESKGLYFNDMSGKEAREHFDKFVKRWNKAKLSGRPASYVEK
ncbi:hypothetical protein BDK51DRAFT_35267, partial [Blyttiomyces helicus]